MFTPDLTFFKEDLFRVAKDVPVFSRPPASGKCPYCGISLALLTVSANGDHIFSKIGTFKDSKGQRGRMIKIRSCEKCNTEKSSLESCMNVLIHCPLEDDDVSLSNCEFDRIIGFGQLGGATLGKHGPIKTLLHKTGNEKPFGVVGYPVTIDYAMTKAFDDLTSLQARAIAMIVTGLYFPKSICHKMYVSNPLFSGGISIYHPHMLLGEADIGFNIGNQAIIGYVWIKDNMIVTLIRYSRQLVACYVLDRSLSN